MAKGNTVNWESQETWQRVVASIIATGVKIDLKQTAIYFGSTYDTLENRFRKIKKEAAVLKEQVGKGECTEVSTPSRTPKKATKSTPQKDALGTVANGRITKSTPKSKKNGVKQEAIEDVFSPSTFGNLGDDTDVSYTHDVDFLAGHGNGGALDEDDDGLGSFIV